MPGVVTDCVLAIAGLPAGSSGRIRFVYYYTASTHSHTLYVTAAALRSQTRSQLNLRSCSSTLPFFPSHLPIQRE